MAGDTAGRITPGQLSDIVGQQGLLAHRSGAGHLDFRFEYLGYPFAVRATSGPDGSTVQIRAILGTLPYTAESRVRRVSALRVLAAVGQSLGQRIRLGANQRIMLIDRRRVREPLTPVNLMTLMATMLLEAKPYLALLAEYAGPTAMQTAGPSEAPGPEADAAPAAVLSSSPAG